MQATTQAFHELILQANRAHKAYNEVRPDASLAALRDLGEQLTTLYHHLQNEEGQQAR